jgi:hypothetical protein
MHFIYITDIPKGSKATYLKNVAANKPDKAVPKGIYWTCGGDKVTYIGGVSTMTADLATAKIMFNSILSTPGAKHMTTSTSKLILEHSNEKFQIHAHPHLPYTIQHHVSLQTPGQGPQRRRLRGNPQRHVRFTPT